MSHLEQEPRDDPSPEDLLEVAAVADELDASATRLAAVKSLGDADLMAQDLRLCATALRRRAGVARD